ncbi:DNA polymerase zeta [Trapelia coarctata]|nr:DNA polymerase zeta [Trapelia coarctata]
MDIFRVRLNCVDHYQATPTELDPQLKRGKNEQVEQRVAPRVPVVRVFGATETGQKVCAHIHGAFPYLYIEYTGSLDPDQVESYIYRLHISIDYALAISYRRNMHHEKPAFVAHITLIKGIPFYGYHVGYRFFFKIYMFNPLHMTRLADLLRQGAVMKKNIQPYESHVQYLLQWMCDYNLYGCAYIECSKVLFRSPVPDYLEISNSSHQWHDRTIAESLIADESSFPRQSHCSIEVDICVQDILNRLDTKARPLHHDFSERTNPAAPTEKLVHSMAGLWRDETRRRKARMSDPDSGSSPFPPEVLISVSADPRNTQRGGWIHEAEYVEKMLAIMKDETANGGGPKVDFSNFLQPKQLESRVKTAFESIEDLFPINIPKGEFGQLGLRMDIGPSGQIDIEEVEVDESRIIGLEQDDFAYDSEEESARVWELAQRQQLDKESRFTGTAGPALNDDDQSGRAATTKPVENVRQSLHVDNSAAVNSSAEFIAAGIRDAGVYDHLEEDAFQIPHEYTSEISSAISRHKRAKANAVAFASERSAKIQKIVHDERSSIRHSSLGDQAVNLPLEIVARPQGDIKEGYAASIVETYEDNESAKSREQSNNFEGPLQDTSSPNGLKGILEDSTLSVPVLQNAQVPPTLPTLRQKSDSSDKASQNAKGKHVSFGTFLDSKLDGLVHGKIRSYFRSQVEIRFPQWNIISSRVQKAFRVPKSKVTLIIASSPPPSSDISSTMQCTKIPSMIYQDAYYSDERDVPERPREYAGKEFKLESNTLPYLADFGPTSMSLASIGEKPGNFVNKIAEEKIHQNLRRICSLRVWEIEDSPPTRVTVQRWLDEYDTSQDLVVFGPENELLGKLSQLDGPSQRNKHGFKYSQKQASTSAQRETQYMSLMSLEIHVNTRGSLVPNPEQDEISCVFWCLQSEDEELALNGVNDGTHVGILALSGTGGLAHKISLHTSAEVEEESSELDLINRMVDIVRNYDPDILTGFEVHGGSWGYMIERARHKYDYNLCDELSRTKSQSHGRYGRENDKWGFNQTSTIRITGRHMINIWRAMRGELNLLQYTMENIAFHLLHRRVPHYTHFDLTKWYNGPKPRDLAKVIEYFVSRVQLDLEILEQNELIPRISEQARLLGVDFFSVISRGSQFKVESLMLRIAKPENYLLVSPSRKQVGQQNALECLPLVMEPQSAFYNSPLLVLDFQSLYPSVMIAYNYCYSTFLGRVVNWRGQNKMGFTDFRREPKLLELLKDHINIAPNGMMYAKPEIRKSLLAKMLGEILETRVMVKSGMKVDRDDKTLQRLLNNRQLALKLIANVTYGYTSASFSGRMPCSEIADSIVQTGRETLEKAIAMIHSVEKWGAEVVYGDTDSLFVYLRGRTREEAFDIGNEIAKTITDMNPRPVKLKFEKVYLPSILLAKKRYVGFKYESKNQKEPDFDAKGIETVRRDGTPAEQKIEEKALKILFRTADLSQVKSYFQKQCMKIMKCKVSIQDFCFAKEVKLGTYSEKGPPPPGALISTRKMLQDPRAEPQYGERVPYVVITGAPGARLVDRCVAPEVLLQNDHNELDAEYYIAKNLIPPLERIFNLVGANVRHWYDEMPKFQPIRRLDKSSFIEDKDPSLSKKTMESYMKSSACLVCRQKFDDEAPVCDECMQQPETSVLKLQMKLNRAESKAVNLDKICRSCAGIAWGEEVRCDSKDCPVFYSRMRHKAALNSTRLVIEPIVKVLEEAEGAALGW